MLPHVAPPRVVRDKCRCGFKKVEAMLKRLKKTDLNEMADKNGVLRVTCEFCKVERAFNKNHLSALTS